MWVSCGDIGIGHETEIGGVGAMQRNDYFIQNLL